MYRIFQKNNHPISKHDRPLVSRTLNAVFWLQPVLNNYRIWHVNIWMGKFEIIWN